MRLMSLQYVYRDLLSAWSYPAILKPHSVAVSFDADIGLPGHGVLIDWRNACRP
jgi:hypothetical protein